MSTGLLVVTAPNADFKVVNRLLLYLRDWGFGEPDTWDQFHLVASKTDPEFDKFKDVERNRLSATKPGDLTAENFNNEWAGASVQEIERYVLEADSTGIDGNEISLFLILDEQGVRDHTCIIAEAYDEWDDEADPPKKIPKEDREAKYDFNKYRAPWDETQIVYVNLNIANQGFEDFADEDEGADEEGWWTFQGHGSLLDEEQVQHRERELKKFEEEGKI